MGRAKVDTGYYETMYDRLLRAKQGREGIISDAWEKYMLQRETAQLNKGIRTNHSKTRRNFSKVNLNNKINQKAVFMGPLQRTATSAATNRTGGPKEISTGENTITTKNCGVTSANSLSQTQQQS